MFVKFLKEFDPCNVTPAIKRSHLVWLFLMAELIVVRIAFASSADFGKAEVNDSERNAVVF